jgi:hypothetical protein
MVEEEAIPQYGYKDVITYCPDRTKLGAEVAAKFPEKLDMETGSFLVTKIPTVKGEPVSSLSLVRCFSEKDEADLSSLTTLEVLGTYEEVWSDPVKKAKYDKVYPRHPVVDEEGNEYIPPEKIGVFA